MIEKKIRSRLNNKNIWSANNSFFVLSWPVVPGITHGSINWALNFTREMFKVSMTKLIGVTSFHKTLWHADHDVRLG